jgi:hypothetical protein
VLGIEVGGLGKNLPEKQNAAAVDSGE